MKRPYRSAALAVCADSSAFPDQPLCKLMRYTACDLNRTRIDGKTVEHFRFVLIHVTAMFG